MDHAERVKLLTEWYGQTLELDGAATEFLDVVGGDSDSCRIARAAWALHQKYTEAIGRLIGDSPIKADGHTWMSWWWYENDEGRKGFTPTINGQVYSAATIDDLATIIEAWAAPEEPTGGVS